MLQNDTRWRSDEERMAELDAEIQERIQKELDWRKNFNARCDAAIARIDVVLARIEEDAA